MTINISTIGKTGADYTSIATWESDSDVDLVTAGDIEILEVHNDLGAITVSSTITFAGATVDASNYRVIKAADGKGWEGNTDDTSAATLACQGNYRLVCEEEYFRFDGMRFTGNGASNFCFGADADNVMVVRGLFDGRSQTFNIAELSGSRAGWKYLRCVFMDCGEYTVDTSASGTNYCQNCTFYGCNYGPSTYGSGRLVYNNSISVGNSNNHYADSPSNWATGTDYNIMGGSDYYPSGNLVQNAVATASTSPGAGTWVMYENITAGDFNIQDHASNEAKDWGKTLTGEVVTDAAGVSASGTWECGALNFYVAPGGEEYDVTITTSISLNHVTGPQRQRYRVNADTFELNDGFILEHVTSFVINSIMISSDLSLGSSTGVQRGRNKLIDSALELGSYIGQQLGRNRKVDSVLALEHDVNIQRYRDRVIESLLDIDSSVNVSRQLDRAITSALKLYDAIVRTYQPGGYQLAERTLSSSLELDDSISPIVWYVRKLLSSLILTHSLDYEKAQFLLNAITLHTELQLNDVTHVERKVFRLAESFVELYSSISQQTNRQRKLTDEFGLYEDILQDAIKVLSDILLHDNLELSDTARKTLQRLFKPIGVIIYGLEKARVQYNVHSSKVEYALEKQKKIIYTLENIKGRTIYH